MKEITALFLFHSLSIEVHVVNRHIFKDYDLMIVEHTWHLHPVHVGLLHTVKHDQMICHLCGCHIFSFPPVFSDIGDIEILKLEVCLACRTKKKVNEFQFLLEGSNKSLAQT